MRLPRTIIFLLALATGCKSPSSVPETAAASTMNVRRVVVFTCSWSDHPVPRKFHLKGAYGIVLRYEADPSQPRHLTYELFSQESGKVMATQSEMEFKKCLKRLPPRTKIDYYDTCTFSLCSEEDKDALRYCDELGIAVGYYVMCTDFGAIGKKRPWQWKKAAVPSVPPNGNQPLLEE